MATNNSLSTVLSEFIRLQNNSLETLQKLQQATVSVAETVEVNVKESDGTINSYAIPSFGYLKSNIDRIDNTISKMLGFDKSDAYIRQPDGTFKKIYQAKNVVNLPAIGELSVPTTFVAENNWFFENLMSPLMRVSFDATRYVQQEETKIFVKRMILNINDERKSEYFNNNVRGKNNLDYLTLLVELQQRGITYFLDEGVVDLPLSVVRYNGNFVPVSYEDRTVTNADGTVSTKRYYLFDKVTYSDTLSISIDTQTLKVGDKIINRETVYEIVEIDLRTRFLRVSRVSGYEPILVGENISFYSETFSPKTISVSIGFDEYTVVFFRRVDDESNLLSTNWSPGIGFNTKDLTINLSTGSSSLESFYKSSVLDFGNYLLSNARDGGISAFDGLQPDPPLLEETNFQIVRINDHKLDQEEITSIRKKQSDKVRVLSEINQLERSINEKKEELNTRRFNSESDRKAVENEIESLIRQRSSSTTLYASIINELSATALDAPAATEAPKYRLRGFFQIPAPKSNPKTGEQNVVQFMTYYRYIRPDGGASNVRQYDFIDSSGATQRASFSSLNEYRSPLRKKTYSPAIGKYVWAEEDLADANTININQVDLPISKGESIEFYVVSVSEAGWPTNPLLSLPSNTITFEFPVDLITEDEASVALQQASQEKIKVDFLTELSSKGVDKHLESSFNAGQKYYAHDSGVISSNFYTSEGNVISLFDKLTEMSLKIQDLENRLSEVITPIKVSIVDESSNTVIEVQNGSVINLLAGYYQDQVNAFPTAQRRGAIITKKYNIRLENPTASPLFLISRFPGGFGIRAPYSGTGASPTGMQVVNDLDYNNYRKYDMTPIVQLGINPPDTNNDNPFSTVFYQGGQVLGQYAYSRYKDVGLVNDLYSFPQNRNLIPDFGPTVGFTAGNGGTGCTASGVYGNTATWVWDIRKALTPGTALASLGSGYATRFSVHIQHPAITRALAGVTASFYSLQFPAVNFNVENGEPNPPQSISAFLHSSGFNTEAPAQLSGNPPSQLGYTQNFLNITTPYSQYSPAGTYQPNSYGEMPNKMGFTSDDRFLIGSQTVGSYLFLGPSTFDQLLVRGVDARANRRLDPGLENAIIIPIVFQYRMTDYYGPPIETLAVASGGGLGELGGYDPQRTASLRNLSYSKKIGIDIYQRDETTFSFDVQVSAIYKRDSLVQVEFISQGGDALENVTFTRESIRNLTRLTQ